jgi:hypothetical protein
VYQRSRVVRTAGSGKDLSVPSCRPQVNCMGNLPVPESRRAELL